MSESELTQFSRNLALRWFEVHAEQRMKMMNFFIVVSGFCVAGFFAALQAKNILAASVVGVVLFIVAICFKQLDRRSAQLVKIAEQSLKSALRPLAEDSNNRDIITLSGERGWVPSYRQTFNALFALFGLLGLAGAFFPWFANP